MEEEQGARPCIGGRPTESCENRFVKQVKTTLAVA